MAPLVKLLGAGSLLAGLVAAFTSRLTRRKRKIADSEVDSCQEPNTRSLSGGHEASLTGNAPIGSSAWPYPALSKTSLPPPGNPAPPPAPASDCGTSWADGIAGEGSQQQLRHLGSASYSALASSSTPPLTSTSCSSSWGLWSRLLVASDGRPSESHESVISGSGGAGSTHGGMDEYDSSDEQELECCGSELRTGYGKSDRARLVDMWIESALLVSRDVRLDKRHFDRTTRQNLKKMRPASAQLILSEIAERCWESTPDIAREVHRLVSHAKAQDKFAVAAAATGTAGLSPGGSSSLACGQAGTMAVMPLLNSGRTGGGPAVAATLLGLRPAGPGSGAGSASGVTGSVRYAYV